MLLRHGSVCSAIGISEAAHLDGWSASFSDGGALSDDPLDIYQWTRDRADEFTKQAETKARLLPMLPPKVVGAFVRYWESRMVGKVKHYTLNDLVEYVFGDDEDDVEALRYTCGRLLEKMQVKAMSDLYEAELVKGGSKCALQDSLWWSLAILCSHRVPHCSLHLQTWFGARIRATHVFCFRLHTDGRRTPPAVDLG